ITDLTCCSASSSLPGHAAGVILRSESSGDKVARKADCEIGVIRKHVYEWERGFYGMANKCELLINAVMNK
ncbi:MAG: hypothetical protein ISS77_08640, partial [Phycisphaerae bacterium]|nr:hypothetical protein [Phycisphaerae bacterium]